MFFKVLRYFRLENVEPNFPGFTYHKEEIHVVDDLKYGDLGTYCMAHDVQCKLNFLENGGWLRQIRLSEFTPETLKMFLIKSEVTPQPPVPTPQPPVPTPLGDPPPNEVL